MVHLLPFTNVGNRGISLRLQPTYYHFFRTNEPRIVMAHRSRGTLFQFNVAERLVRRDIGLALVRWHSNFFISVNWTI